VSRRKLSLGQGGRDNPGRPSTGLSEERITLRLPTVLVETVRASAAAQGISLSEWVRRAAHAEMGRAAGLLDGAQASGSKS
jgi:hypothetical protein